MNRNNGSSLLSFLIGAAAGSIIGILYAPDKGSNTRDKLSYRLHKYRKSLEELIDDLINEEDSTFSEAKTHGEKVVNDAREKAERLLEDVDELLSHINKKTDN